jgi:PIN domain nuclease of toxin-antitoxin system
VRLLLDTHMVIWAALDPDALTGAERKRMAESETPLVLSAGGLGTPAEVAQLSCVR